MHTLQYFALKTIRSNDPVDGIRLKRFIQEARVAAAIDSEHVVRVFDVRPDYVHEGTPLPYLVMELVDGCSLQELLDLRGQLLPGEVVWALRQIVAGLVRIHESGVVHRDLKPSNVLLAKSADRELCAKLCDLGIAKFQAGSGDLERESAMFTTESDCVLGTPRYMAPEQLHQTGLVSAATDQWSLALIAFRSLTGRDYFSGTRNGLRLALAIVNEDLVPPCELSRRLPKGFDLWFLRSCARDPRARFPDVQEQLEALELALQRPKVIPARLGRLPSEASSEMPVVTRQRPARTRTIRRFHCALLASSVCLSLLGSTWAARHYARFAPGRPLHQGSSASHLAQESMAIRPWPAVPIVRPSMFVSPISSALIQHGLARPAASPHPSAAGSKIVTPPRPPRNANLDNVTRGTRLPAGAHCLRSSQCASRICLAEECQ